MEFPRHDRYDFVPIDERLDYSWPDGKRLAVYFGNNIEEFAFRAGLNEAGLPAPIPATRTYAQRDYGNRVGIWRMLDLLDDLGAPASHNINTAIFDHSPQVAKRIKERGDEMIGHGRTNSERQDVFSEAEEKEMIEHCVEAIENNGGKRPTGWLSPFLAESTVTPDLLKEAGYDYTLNWPCDDQPFWMRTRAGPPPQCALHYRLERPARHRQHLALLAATVCGNDRRPVRRDARGITAPASGVLHFDAHLRARVSLPYPRPAPSDRAHHEAPRRYLGHKTRRDRGLLQDPAGRNHPGQLSRRRRTQVKQDK